MQDRGLAAYIAELVGTLFLTFFVTSAVVLYVASGQNAQFGSDFAVIGLVHAFVLASLIFVFGGVSGGHFNPAGTFAAVLLRRIDPIDGIVYVLAQLSGGVLGALLTKGLLSDEGRAGDYGAAKVSALLGGDFQGFLVEGIGTLMLVLAVVSLALHYAPLRSAAANAAAGSAAGRGDRANADDDARTDTRDWAPLGIGITLGFVVMVFGPLTGSAVNPARWFGPALVGNDFGSVWPYVAGPFVGAALAAGIYWLVIHGGGPGTPAPTAAGNAAGRAPGTGSATPSPPSSPPASATGSAGTTPGSTPAGPAPGSNPPGSPPPASPPGGLLGG